MSNNQSLNQMLETYEQARACALCANNVPTHQLMLDDMPWACMQSRSPTSHEQHLAVLAADIKSRVHMLLEGQKWGASKQPLQSHRHVLQQGPSGAYEQARSEIPWLRASLCESLWPLHCQPRTICRLQCCLQATIACEPIIGVTFLTVHVLMDQVGNIYMLQRETEEKASQLQTSRQYLHGCLSMKT
jgi:hypothetical protein